MFTILIIKPRSFIYQSKKFNIPKLTWKHPTIFLSFSVCINIVYNDYKNVLTKGTWRLLESPS